jgi:hypothetical protein
MEIMTDRTSGALSGAVEIVYAEASAGESREVV